ncbi:MAG: hypothetical protein ACXW20_05950 [Burkholderiales bacterium]
MSDNWFYRLSGVTRGKYWLSSADDEMRKDGRRPVVYLRSFAFELGEYSGSRFFGNWFAQDMLGIPPSEEQRIFGDHMRLIGPYIAIARPDEPFPELGAARKQVAGADWQQVVGEPLDRSAAVVVQASTSSGLLWELEQLKARGMARKVLWILPRWQGEYEAFRARVAPLLSCPLPAKLPKTRLVAFRDDWEPYVLEARSGLLWTLKPFFDQNGFPFPRT